MQYLHRVESKKLNQITAFYHNVKSSGDNISRQNKIEYLSSYILFFATLCLPAGLAII